MLILRSVPRLPRREFASFLNTWAGDLKLEAAGRFHEVFLADMKPFCFLDLKADWGDPEKAAFFIGIKPSRRDIQLRMANFVALITDLGPPLEISMAQYQFSLNHARLSCLAGTVVSYFS